MRELQLVAYLLEPSQLAAFGEGSCFHHCHCCCRRSSCHGCCSYQQVRVSDQPSALGGALPAEEVHPNQDSYMPK